MSQGTFWTEMYSNADGQFQIMTIIAVISQTHTREHTSYKNPSHMNILNADILCADILQIFRPQSLKTIFPSSPILVRMFPVLAIYYTRVL